MHKYIIHFIFTLLILHSTSYALEAQFKIALDIGHTPKKWGATSCTNQKEYDYNKKLVLELHESLTKNNIQSFIINEKGDEIDLEQRTQIAQEKNADLFLSIHHDSVQTKYLSYDKKDGRQFHYSNHFEGYSLFVSNKNKYYEQSLAYAKLLGQELLKENFTPTLHHAEPIDGENRTLLDTEKGIYEFSDLIVLKTASMPSVLFEVGIIVNQHEEKKLQTKSYREKLIQSIVKSLIEYKTN